MFESLKKSKQLSLMMLDRLGDYLALMRIEMKLQGRDIGVQLMAYLAAALFVVFALLFTGIAIIVSFWDSDARGIAAWAVVAIYIASAGIAVALGRRHAHRIATLTTLREELKRDVALVRESL